MRVGFTVTGGAPPYTVASLDSAKTLTAASGELEFSCARSGINLAKVAPDANVVESGPKTVTAK